MSKLLVGFGRMDISPEDSVPLGGFGRALSRMSEGIGDPLLATCLAITDEAGSTVLVFSFDLGNMSSVLANMRQDVAAATGIPVENIMFSATHTHSSPALGIDHPNVKRYCEKLRRCVVECAVQALADRKEATLSTGSIQTQNMNFVRRYVLEDGTFAGDNYGHFAKSPIACHETEPDRMLQLVKFTREGGKDILMANFQGHPHKGAKYRFHHVTSDLVYHFRQQLEADTGCLSVYFSGASGNVNCTSRIPEENITADYMEHGRALAAYALEATKHLKSVESGCVQHKKTVYVGRCNHLEDHKVEQAKIVVERWQNGAKFAESLVGFEDIINSPFHATSIISKAARPETMDVELNVLHFGDVAMAFAPFELYCDLGKMIKEGSPFDTTFVCCYANTIFSYMPTLLGFQNGGYGPNQCRFEPGTGELIADRFTDMLAQLQT